MQPSMQKPFSIIYNEEKNFVEMKSVERIPFEPKGWKYQMREELKVNLKKIITDKNKILYAAYCDNAKGPHNFDLENVLFYNIGTSNFSNFASKGIIFETTPFPVEGSLFEEENYYYYYKYMLINPEESSSFWEQNEIINQFELLIDQEFKTSYKPEFYWIKTKQGNIITHNTPSKHDFLGIKLVINGPSDSEVNLTTFIKTLIDGIFSAFFYLPEKPDPLLVKILKDKTGKSEDFLENLLCNKENAILGPYSVIHFFNKRKSVQWNPPDDRLLYVKAFYQNSAKKNNWTVEGELFSINITEDPRWAFEYY